MNLRVKTIFFSLLITILTFAAFYFTSSRLVLNAFQRLEDQNTRTSMYTLLNGINNQFLDMNGIAMTYAPWINSFHIGDVTTKRTFDEDTFNQANLTNMNFAQNDIQLVLFFNQNNQLVDFKTFPTQHVKQIPVALISKEILNHRQLFFQSKGKELFQQGILQTPQGPLMIVSNSIRNGKSLNSIKGHFIIGRFFTSTEAANLSARLNMPITIENPQKVILPIDKEKLTQNSLYHASYWTVDYGYKFTNAYLEVPDVNDNPALILLSESKNSFLSRGENALTYFSWFLGILSVGYGLFIIAYFNFSIVRRLRRIFQVIRFIRKRDNLEARINVRGKDEISQLGIEFNALMDGLAESQKIITYQAYHDRLTGLYNRNQFQTTISEHCIDSRKFFLFILDIKQFKNVNDTFGQRVGDQLLIELSRRIEKIVETRGFIARLGGDEFSVLLNESETEQAQLTSYAIIEQLSLPYQIGEFTLSIGLNIGVSRYPDDGTTEELLIQRAERNMLAMKRLNLSNDTLFSLETWQRVSRRIRLEEELEKAIENDQIYAVYQPKVNAVTEQLEGMEALLRWRHPELGEISPGEFIPIAEETGLIMDLGYWILRRACIDLEKWDIPKYSTFRMAVNLSSLQLADHNLPQIIKRVIEETGVNPNKLELEITESVVMKNVSDAITTLNILRKMGLEISIDDFGTGYSSLSYLKEFPVNYIKIDQSFIRDLSSHPFSANIVKGIIELSHGLQFKVVAEGVETKEQLEKLRIMQCDEIQGYLFGRPQTIENY